MHPLVDDPLYDKCQLQITAYLNCESGSLVTRLTNECAVLMEEMNKCMRQQRLLRRDLNKVKSDRKARIERDLAIE